jgi:hypothetical protein
MKKYFITISILLLLQVTNYGQTYTPNGTYVSVEDRPEFDPDDIAYGNAYANSTYPNASIWASTSNTCNCHAWAWSVSEGGQQDWMYTPNDDLY